MIMVVLYTNQNLGKISSNPTLLRMNVDVRQRAKSCKGLFEDTYTFAYEDNK